MKTKRFTTIKDAKACEELVEWIVDNGLDKEKSAGITRDNKTVEVWIT